MGSAERTGRKSFIRRALRPPKLHKLPSGRADWEQMDLQGGTDVVKGVSHRVIVVKSPDKYFEEAIFVIREDVLQAKGADSAFVLRQARQAANSYVKKRAGKRGPFYERLPALLVAAAGAAATGIAWLALHLCHV